jgi:Fe2+ transport system protein FeoA
MPMTLDQLATGEKAMITKLSCTGTNRRRLMDLGILPQTRIQTELISPLGDPIAYRVRETLIALRREQANQIEVEPLNGDLS